MNFNKEIMLQHPPKYILVYFNEFMITACLYKELKLPVEILDFYDSYFRRRSEKSIS